MTLLRTIVLPAALLAVCFGSHNAKASELASDTGTAQTAPDNSKQNKDQAPTADNQPNSQSDRMTTAKIRKAIIADKSLSTYAHNIKIITANGAVTLKGPVKSDEEKQRVASVAATVVSADKISDELTVKQ